MNRAAMTLLRATYRRRPGSIALEDCGSFGENVAEICATAGVKLKFLNNQP